MEKWFPERVDMKKVLLLFGILIILCFMCSCENNNQGTSLSENQTDKDVSSIVPESEDISDEFLAKRYPGKQILHWVYGEENRLTKDEINIFEEKYGTHRITSKQIIMLNDYLVSLGKDYVINYQRMGCGEEYIDEVKAMIKTGEAPDFITAMPFRDSEAELYCRIMKFDFINEGLLEELTPYLEKELQSYKNSVPENIYKLSKVNNKFYGFDTNILDIEENVCWYVNAELAEKYNIDINSIGQMDYEDWIPYFQKVYAGEKKEGTENLKMIADYAAPIVENSALGYVGEFNGLNYITTDVFGINSLEGKIESYYAKDEVKKSYRAYSEYYNNGYFKYLNPSRKNEDTIDTGNCFIFLDRDMSEEDKTKEAQIIYPKVKKLKKISYCRKVYDGGIKDSGVTGICSASEHKDMAMDALNIIYSDEIAANITKYPQYNVGDDDFTISESDMIISQYENYAGPSNLLTNPFVATNYAEYANEKDMAEKINSVTISDKFAGKIYNYTKVKKQIRNIQKIEKKYIDTSDELKGNFLKGDFEVTWAHFLDELGNAGIDKVIKYLNEQ